MAAIPQPLVTGIDSIERTTDGTVTLRLVSATEPLTIHLSKSALTELFVLLTSLQPPASGLPFDLAPLRALGVRPFGQADGTAGLLFELPGAWNIPFAIPAGAISGVRNAIDQVESLLEPTGGATQ